MIKVNVIYAKILSILNAWKYGHIHHIDDDHKFHIHALGSGKAWNLLVGIYWAPETESSGIVCGMLVCLFLIIKQ